MSSKAKFPKTQTLAKMGFLVLFFLTANLVLGVDTTHPISKAEDVKVALFTHAHKERCFLNQEELQSFSLVLTRLERRTNPPGVSHVYWKDGDFAFSYWLFSEKKMDLVQLVVEFYADGTSSMYVVSEEDKKVIQSLCKVLLLRAK